ncbi:MAG: YdcF family protein [Solibacillus sp.]
MKRFFLFIVGAVIVTTIYCAITIWQYGHTSEHVKTDAAIVLGAAIWESEPSPVLRERIHHAVQLYTNQMVESIIFTGGKGDGDILAESEVARDYAIKLGVPADAIFIETSSRITEENLRNAKILAEEVGAETVTIVSDPLHMKRAMLLAEYEGLTAYSSPTQTTAYTTYKTKIPFLMREVFYYIGTICTAFFR